MSMHKNLTTGFGLVEVLVALVILTIGLLGMAGLQGYSISGSYNAHLRTQATALAQDIIDRMRANQIEASTNNAYQTDFGNAPPTGANCIGLTADCDTTDLAEYDLREWKCSLGRYTQNAICAPFNLQSTLPQGDGRIVTQADGQIQVTVQWSDTEGDAGDVHQVMLTTNL